MQKILVEASELININGLEINLILAFQNYFSIESEIKSYPLITIDRFSFSGYSRCCVSEMLTKHQSKLCHDRR